MLPCSSTSRGADFDWRKCRSRCGRAKRAALSTRSASRSTTHTRTCWPRSWCCSSGPPEPKEATMEFPSRIQIISALAAVALALYVLELVRRRRLSEEYSLLWVVAPVVVAFLGFSTPLLRSLTHALGILYEGSTVFFFGLTFAIAMLLYLSVRLSRLGQENHALTRELALVRYEIEELRAGLPASGGPSHRGSAE